MKSNLRLLYLYLFSFVGLLIVVIGSIQMVDLSLKLTVFKDVDLYVYTPAMSPEGKPLEDVAIVEERQRREMTKQHQRQFITAFSMIVVGLPLYLYHWKTIQKENATT